MGWVNDKGAKAIKKFDDGGEVKVVDKEDFSDDGRKTTKTKVVQVDTPLGKRYYEGIGTSRSDSTADALANAIIQTKIKENPSDSLTTEDFNLKYGKKKKKKRKGWFK